MSTERERRFRGPIRGQLLFAGAFFVLSAVLLSQIGAQTRWAEGKQLVAQPRFWPGVGLGGMVLFGGLYLRALPRHRLMPDDRKEARLWVSALEWAGWFLLYVTAVPRFGYLPVSIAFAIAMTWRLGYRSGRWLVGAGAFGAAVVVLFKAFLSVKIPGGAVYDLLPEAIRTFFYVNF